jgi:Protein of unknown function (DUF1194)
MLPVMSLRESVKAAAGDLGMTKVHLDMGIALKQRSEWVGRQIYQDAAPDDRWQERYPTAGRAGMTPSLGRLAANLCAMLMAIALAIGSSAPAAAQAAVDLQLVLAVDVAGSVSDERFKLQHQGYAQAFRSWRVLEAIQSGSARAIAVTMTHWTGPSQQQQVVPWMVISDEASMLAFAEGVERTTRQLSAGGTSISGAIDHAMTLFPQSSVRAGGR